MSLFSFETIEHLNEHDKFLSEARRVLRPGGIFIVSTPDRDNYSPADRQANPYHVLELTQSEFSNLLRRHFPHVAMGWQRPLIGSALLPGPESHVAQETVCFERRGDSHFEVSRGYARPLYLIAICSDEPPPPLPASIYIESGQLYSRENDLKTVVAVEQSRVRAAEADGVNHRLRADAAEAAARTAEIAAREIEGMASAARLALEAEKATTEQLRREVEARDRQIADLYASSSWRLTAPLRAVSRLLSVRVH